LIIAEMRERPALSGYPDNTAMLFLAPPVEGLVGEKRRTGMGTLLRLLKSLRHDESGQDLIEYALIAALIAVAAIAALKGLDNKIDNEFNAIGNSL
jgi:pilus assembly protein Flp/PilA